MNRPKYYQGVWDVVILLLAIALAAMFVMWAGQAAGDEPVGPSEPKTALVVSPWEGVFRAGDAMTGVPFVEVGSHVSPTTVVGLIDLDVMQPDRKMEVYAGVQGTVVQVHVEDGSYVTAGQVLMMIQLDPPDT